jgi:hypothetical protein
MGLKHCVAVCGLAAVGLFTVGGTGGIAAVATPWGTSVAMPRINPHFMPWRAVSHDALTDAATLWEDREFMPWRTVALDDLASASRGGRGRVWR